MKHAFLALLLTLSACALDDQAPETAETTSDLSVYGWSTPTTLGESFLGAAVANLNGVAYMVHGSATNNYLWWRRQTAGGSWTSSVIIPGRVSTRRVSLAAFNGYLYMLSTSSTDVVMSRFNPSTQQWSGGSSLPYTSVSGPPAIAEYNGVLRFVGASPTTNQLWTATMSAWEVLSSATPMEGHYSAGRITAAVYNNRYHIVHRAGTTSQLVANSFDGASWGWDTYLGMTGWEASIAPNAGYLHIVHRGASSSNVVWWSYFDGNSWAPEQTIPNLVSVPNPSLGQGQSSIVLTTANSSATLRLSTYF